MAHNFVSHRNLSLVYFLLDFFFYELFLILALPGRFRSEYFHKLGSGGGAVFAS